MLPVDSRRQALPEMAHVEDLGATDDYASILLMGDIRAK
jgi:hypothetical protein